MSRMKLFLQLEGASFILLDAEEQSEHCGTALNSPLEGEGTAGAVMQQKCCWEGCVYLQEHKTLKLQGCCLLFELCTFTPATYPWYLGCCAQDVPWAQSCPLLTGLMSLCAFMSQQYPAEAVPYAILPSSKGASSWQGLC